MKHYRLNFTYTMMVYANDEDDAAFVGYNELEHNLANGHLYGAQFALHDELEEIK